MSIPGGRPADPPRSSTFGGGPGSAFQVTSSEQARRQSIEQQHRADDRYKQTRSSARTQPSFTPRDIHFGSARTRGESSSGGNYWNSHPTARNRDTDVGLSIYAPSSVSSALTSNRSGHNGSWGPNNGSSSNYGNTPNPHEAPSSVRSAMFD